MAAWISRCGSRRTTRRQNRVVVGRSARSASTACVASSRCRAPSGTASRHRTASRTARGSCCETRTHATRTRHHATNATCQPPPASQRRKSATGSRTGVSETGPPSSSTGACAAAPARYCHIPSISLVLSVLHPTYASSTSR